METNIIIYGDCIEEMKKLPENSVDAIVTDSPYGLEFMGKEWDKFKKTGKSHTMYNIQQPKHANVYKKKNFKVLPRLRVNNYELQVFVNSWATECLRVLKPGGFLLSFGGTRTYHRMTCGIEDAGFEIRDTIMWIYGSGFPKSLNISKAVEKEREKIFLEPITKGKDVFELGLFSEEVKFCEWIKKESGLTQKDLKEMVGHDRFYTAKVDIVNTATTDNPIYGRRCNVPTSNAWQKIKERIKVEIPEEIEKLVKLEAEGFKRGPGQEQTWQSGKGEGTKSYNEWGGWGTALKPAVEPIVVARKPLSEKNVALNVLKWGTGGINIDECRIGNDIIPAQERDNSVNTNFMSGGVTPEHQGRFPANIIFDEEAGKMLDEQSGESTTTPHGGDGQKLDTQDMGWGFRRFPSTISDKVGASRFFYMAKTSSGERNYGCEELEDKDGNIKAGIAGMQGLTLPKKNVHPTVKPIKLMEYLIKLVSPKGTIVLDPFLGSGTTAIACLNLDRKFIGIEKEEEYIKIAELRVKFWEKPKERREIQIEKHKIIERAKQNKEQKTLW